MRLLAGPIVCGAILGGGCGGPGAGVDLPPPTPGLELRGEDFAQARAAFSTRLTRHAPPPGQAQALPAIPDAETVEYASGHLRLKAYRSRPSAGPARRPAVLFLHGGFSFGEGHWEMSRPFREAGFVVMTPVLRGENGQPGDFSLFGDEVGDVLAAADVLASAPDVDPRNVFVAGHSVGGTLAMLAAMTSRRFRAAASFSGSPDLNIYLKVSRTPAPFDASSAAEVRLRSAVAYASSFKCPARLYYGEDEIWVQSSTSRTAVLASRAGLDVAAVELPGDHFSSVQAAIRESIAFFRQHMAAD
ncbi:Alpha/beta hydrolase family protein [Aquisphaera giovannonii]|uniref:Alpha/beta hydrolase family protein n=1 Tax=Aquisphaera giovannonii TaxID=406548 RepID=A0A5B9WBE0_9BACT|nr:alpha/beta fold hydrolase [Aquisphaera giovannonii]QEH37916.1 Alpha/beta hydrolase family protein [Aquisphaera giovannonii]